MADFFTAEQAATLSAQVVRCAIVAKFDFLSETIYAWNGDTELVVDGNTYIPMHGMASIDGFSVGNGTASTSVDLMLSGIASAGFLAQVLAETADTTQQMATLSLVLFDENWQVASVPLPIFYGFMQPPRVTRTPMGDVSGAIQSVSMTIENVFFNRSLPPFGRYTDRDQQGRSPGDLFFGFVSSLLNKTITYPDY